ncbi:lysyl-tRNA synthetase [miscellaneous Crenarchaeota group-15 archaeon DG-45]|uniref:Lysine--tRNA ligase n=1 Tax=miscellaneous Crenarchaeota group-15 archaeon DG-45 TaxID=1685127 RepID=A0A0M0BSM9_9ARCH|nr:MAG: lysyl-tRNA synthetase [miscellaneous Crenarchaeota group-15 archaeon DG-45]
MQEIIGLGTWYDKAAKELIDRERLLGRSLDLIRTESGLGASGFPHIGSLGDALRNYAVALGVQVQGYDSELIAFSDDKDGLRRVPAGLDRDLAKWLGYPVSAIPDPFGGCHDSFGAHMTSLLLEALDTSGAEYTFMSGAKVYEEGLLDEEILVLMENADLVGEIIDDELGQAKYLEALPYFPVCESCGRIYTTNAHRYLADEHKVLYRCDGMEVKGRWLEGCGHEGEADVLAGRGKLSWKVEFAARWRALDIRFEAYGKDIADSVRVNDRICREVLGFEPPMHVQYEMFLDRGGKKISKSAGNVFTPQVWYRYGSPQSLNLLILKRFVGAKSGSVEEIPSHMDELDDLEDIYFGKAEVSDATEQAKLSGLFAYCWMLKPPEEPSVHTPYNLITHLAMVAPTGSEPHYIKEKLREYGYLKDGDSGLERRIGYALNWVKDFGEPSEQSLDLTAREAKAVEALIAALRRADNEDGYQSAVFDSARMGGLPPGRLFKILYRALIGRERGPRFGPYVAVMGKEKVIEKLENVLLER